MSRSTGRTQHLTKGTPIEFTLKGTVDSVTASGALSIKTANGYWLLAGNDPAVISIKPVVPPHRKVKPGQVWEADGLKWFARKSRPELSPRFVPEDMTDDAVAKGIKTLDESAFFIKYPAAKLVFPVSQKPTPAIAFDHDSAPHSYASVRNGYLSPANK